ncbi:MAG: DUF3021 domain-containing protein [Clostridia bacterium]|nr:DUF3021 domain-containing protein [Clostridia bacterium]
MKNYLSQFLKRGLIGVAFGPVILAMIYGIIGATNPTVMLTPGEVCRGILSVSLMSFIAGGVPFVYQIERLPYLTATMIHGVALYLDYLIMYLANDWIPRSTGPLVRFTVIYALGFVLISVIVYVSIRRNTRKLNEKLHAAKRA